MIRLQAILMLETTDDLQPDEAHDILEYAAEAIMAYSSSKDPGHIAHKIKRADIPALIMPRVCSDETCEHDHDEEEEKGPIQ